MSEVRLIVSAATVSHAISTVTEIVGEHWVRRQFEAEAAKDQRNQARVRNLRNAALFEPAAHKLIQWIKFSQEALREFEANNGAFPRLVEQVPLICQLALHLATARKLKGFDRIPGRLRDRESFDSAAFECDVASTFVTSGWAVEFVGEAASKTPDLLVHMGQRKLHVECKLKDQLSEKAAQAGGVVTQMQAALNRRLGPQKANCLISVVVNVAPEYCDVEPFILEVQRAVDCGGCGAIRSSEISYESILDGKYGIAIHRLSPPDVWIDGPFFIDHDVNCVWDAGAEMMNHGGGRQSYRNPWGYFFKLPEKIDQVAGVYDSLKAAASQIPKEGPGAIVVGAPHGVNVDDFLRRSAEVAKRFLQPSQNRRINAVCIQGTSLQQQMDGDKLYFALRSSAVVVQHPNPKCPG